MRDRARHPSTPPATPTYPPLAHRKAGLTLSDSGLSLTRRDAVTGKKVETRESVQCTSEEDVFDALGVEFVGPEYRDVGEFRRILLFLRGRAAHKRTRKS